MPGSKWAQYNSKIFIEHQLRGEQIVISGPNMDTNTNQFQKFDRTQIRILFGFRNMAKYEYKYCTGKRVWPNTNTIWSATFV